MNAAKMDEQIKNGLIRSHSEGSTEFDHPSVDHSMSDKNHDVVKKVVINYRRILKIKPGVVPENVDWEYVTWDYNERLSIDGTTDTIEYYRDIGEGCKITNTYYIQEGITDFLNGVDPSVFSITKGNPPDAVDNPLDKNQYTITVYTELGNNRIVTGSFDKNGLPTDWPEFINEVFELMGFYGIGDIFDQRNYERIKRRQSDYIFCNVEFEEGGRTYCYLADSDDYREGDLVVVPAGQDNHEAVARIESIEYHQAEDAPIPIEKTKHILRIYNVDED